MHSATLGPQAGVRKHCVVKSSRLIQATGLCLVCIDDYLRVRLGLGRTIHMHCTCLQYESCSITSIMLRAKAATNSVYLSAESWHTSRG